MILGFPSEYLDSIVKLPLHEYITYNPVDIACHASNRVSYPSHPNL